MKRWLLVLSIVITISSITTANNEPFYAEGFPESNYIFVGDEEDEIKYIEKDTIRISKQNNQVIVDFWVVSLYKIGGLLHAVDFLEKSGIDREQCVDLRYEKTHMKATDDYFMAIIGSAYYTFDDYTIYSYSSGRDYKWRDVLPKSNGEFMYKVVFAYLKEQGLLP
jgi:hypothetical protein